MELLLRSMIIPTSMFVAILLFLKIGQRLGDRDLLANPASDRSAGLGTLEGALFALLGLMIAFCFSGAASRFDLRREMIVKEANIIGTAYLRLDLLPKTELEIMQAKFREYLDSRIKTYHLVPNMVAVNAEIAHSNEIQRQIWSMAISAAKNATNPPVSILLLPALNEMIDITTTRTMAALMHPPMAIFFMLCILVVVCSLLAGYGFAGRKHLPWMHFVGFAVILATTVYVVLDLEFPRLGYFTVEAHDVVLDQLRESMK